MSARVPSVHAAPPCATACTTPSYSASPRNHGTPMPCCCCAGPAALSAALSLHCSGTAPPEPHVPHSARPNCATPAALQHGLGCAAVALPPSRSVPKPALSRADTASGHSAGIDFASALLYATDTAVRGPYAWHHLQLCRGCLGVAEEPTLGASRPIVVVLHRPTVPAWSAPPLPACPTPQLT